MITRDITTSPELLIAAWNSLTEKDISDLIQAGIIKKRLNYHVNLSNEGPFDSGSGQILLSYVHVESGMAIVEGEWKTRTFDANQIRKSLEFLMGSFEPFMDDIIETYGGVPPITVTVKEEVIDSPEEVI